MKLINKQQEAYVKTTYRRFASKKQNFNYPMKLDVFDAKAVIEIKSCPFSYPYEFEINWDET